MKSSAFIQSLLLTIGATGYFVASAPGVERSTPTSGSAGAPEAPASTSGAEKAASDISKRLREFIAGGGSTLAGKVTPAHIDAFLSKSGRTAANLGAVWEVTGNKQWLEKALTEFPNAPVVLLLALSEKNDPRRAEWIARFKNADRDNPLPWLFSGEFLATSGKVAEARAELAEALKRPGFNAYLNERINAGESLIAQAGIAADLGIFPAMFGLKTHHLGTAQSLQKSISAALPNDAATGQQIRSLGKMLQTGEAGRLVISQFTGIAIESKGLAALPEAEQKAQSDILLARRNEIKSATDFFFKSLTDGKAIPLISEYLRRLKADGELAALRWLRDQSR